MKLIRSTLITLLFVSACSSSNTATSTSTSMPIDARETTLPTVTPACIPPEPTEEDIERALSFAEDSLEVDEWQQEYAVLLRGVSVTWQNIPQNAVIYLETLIFPCGYEELDLDQYFDDGNWDAIFANYEDYEMVGECSTDDGLRLYEFEASNQDFDYEIQYWVLNDTDTRVITTLMTFPFGSESLLDEYSSRLFPELPACP
jgi:hypothetical protein